MNTRVIKYTDSVKMIYTATVYLILKNHFYKRYSKQREFLKQLQQKFYRVSCRKNIANKTLKFIRR